MRSFLLVLIDSVFGVIIILLFFRIILKLFDANPYTPFTHWVYAFSRVFMKPFLAIFHSNFGRYGSILDTSAIFALIIYSCLGLLIFSIFEKEYNVCNRKTKKIITQQTAEYENDDF